MDPNEREIIIREIKRWQEEGLLPPEICQRLLDSYIETQAVPLEGIKAQTPAEPEPEPAPPARRGSFSQALLSETAVNTALYLGGFFILVAAFIIAALVASARLPILAAATLIFLSGSLFTLRRLPQVSLVLFLIGSVLIPIDAQVISGMLDLSLRAGYLFWALVSFLAAFVWSGGYLLFRSWIFSSLAFLGAAAAVFLAGAWFDLDGQWTALLLSLVMLAALSLAVRPGSRYGKSLMLPLLILSQVGESWIILWLLFQVLIERIQPAFWLAAAAIWLLAALYYTLSDWLVRRRYAFSPFPFAAASCLAAAPLFFFWAFSPTSGQSAWLAFILGLLFSLAAEGFWRWPQRAWKVYSLAGYLTGALLFAGAVIPQIILEDFISSEIFLVSITIFYLALHQRQKRWWLWAPGLLAASLAYFNLFLSGPFSEASVSPGYVFLWPTLFFFALTLLIYKGVLIPGQEPAHAPSGREVLWIPPLAFAILCGLTDLGLLLNSLDQAWTAPVFLIYAVFFAACSIFISQPLIAALATASLALALVSRLLFAKVDNLLTPILFLAVIYYLAGLGLAYWHRARRWGEVVLWSGLILGALAACLAPFNTEPFTILGAALIALFFAVEGRRRRSVWYGLPACFVFYLAYLTALRQLDVSQPQYYSIAAAVLGVVMHNLFLRSKNKTAAFFAGIIAILILLSTTFAQMVQSEELRYFLLLFVESLLLLGYGLAQRSRSFFFLPIIYLVLATIVVMTTVLSGVPTALIIGCTGLFLLGLGILALVMRERLVKVSERVGERFNIW